MRRREFITLFGGGAVAWPLAARAQQRERMRLIGVLLPAAPDDAEFQSWFGAFLQGLAQSGWITGRNIRIETRWTKFDPDESRKYAAELVALAPDVILAVGVSTVGPVLRMSRAIPIVFPLASDPVAAGLVENLARPGGNATGFMSFEAAISAKWLELLKEIAPSVKRVAVLRTLTTATGPGQFGAIQAVAPSVIAVMSAARPLSPMNRHSPASIERPLRAMNGREQVHIELARSLVVLNQYCSEDPLKILFQQHRPTSDMGGSRLSHRKSIVRPFGKA